MVFCSTLESQFASYTEMYALAKYTFSNTFSNFMPPSQD